MKITKKENIRIVIEPYVWFYPKGVDKSEPEIKACNEIIQNIKRHVDDIDNIYIEWDTNLYCSYCELEWELDETGCPTCCQKAIDEYEKDKNK